MSQMVKVKLLKPHTHGAVKFDAGMELEVSPSDASWLVNLKVAENVELKQVATKGKNNEEQAS